MWATVRYIVHVIWWDFKILFKDRQLAFWVLIAPILLALLFGYMSKGGDPDIKTSKVKIENLDEKHTLHEALRRQSIREDPEAESILRFDLDDPLKVTVIAKKKSKRLQLRIKVMAAIAEYIAGIDPNGKKKVSASIRPWEVRNPFPTGFAFSIPAIITMYVFFNLFGFLQGEWVQERKSHFFYRMMASSLDYRIYFIGKVISRSILGGLTTLVLVIVALLYGVKWGAGLGVLSILLVCFIVGSVSLGFLCSHISREQEAATGLGIFLALLAAAMGGCWWPLEVVSPGMQSFAQVLPTGQMMDAFMKSFLYPTPDFCSNLVYMIAYAVLSLVIAWILLREAIVRIRNDT